MVSNLVDKERLSIKFEGYEWLLRDKSCYVSYEDNDEESMTLEKYINPVRGTHDLYGDDLRRQMKIIDVCYRFAGIFGFNAIETPIFEYAPVFRRSLGDTSDIVGKETYTFLDRGGEEITLRPEGTASVVRAAISNSLIQQLPLKVIYQGPMFRYERPQKGRYRQFHQVGIECLGLPDPYCDVECMALGVEVLSQLGIEGCLEINSLGDKESRLVYRQALVEYLEKYANDLSPDSQVRLTKNPLRILDSKDAGDQKILEGAPVFDRFLTVDAAAFYEKVRLGLELLGIPACHNPRLVRGLDYYCHTAFEITTQSLGAQSALLAGGRYDQLVEQMGGPSTSGFGWALGVERLALLMSELPDPVRPLAVIPVTEAEQGQALQLASHLRKRGHVVELCYGQAFGKRFKQANKVNARFALILGSEECASQKVTVKDLDAGVQQIVDLNQLDHFLSTH